MAPVIAAAVERYVLQSLLSGDFPFNRTSRTASMLRMAAALLIAIGTGFLIYAMHLWLQANYTPDMAALISAGTVFALAALAGCISWLIVAERRSRLAAMKEDVKRNLHAVFETLDDELGQPIRDNPIASLVLACVTGYAVADRVI